MRMSQAVLLLGGSGRRLSTATSAGGAAAAAGGLSAEQLGAIPLAFPAVCMWGSNTGVGKTLFSAGLAAACRRAGVSVQPKVFPLRGWLQPELHTSGPTSAPAAWRPWPVYFF